MSLTTLPVQFSTAVADRAPASNHAAPAGHTSKHSTSRHGTAQHSTARHSAAQRGASHLRIRFHSRVHIQAQRFPVLLQGGADARLAGRCRLLRLKCLQGGSSSAGASTAGAGDRRPCGRLTPQDHRASQRSEHLAVVAVPRQSHTQPRACHDGSKTLPSHCPTQPLQSSPALVSGCVRRHMLQRCCAAEETPAGAPAEKPVWSSTGSSACQHHLPGGATGATGPNSSALQGSSCSNNAASQAAAKEWSDQHSPHVVAAALTPQVGTTGL